MDKALLIIDMQKDFCPGGKLPVKDCSKILNYINKYIEKFKAKDLPIIASRDWHPSETNHFAKFGGKWPKHCMQNTEGAEFHPELRLPEDAIIISKGTKPDEDSYSAFEGHDDKNTLLGELLKGMGVEELFVCGLATEYCVKSSALDAIKGEFKVYLLMDAIEGVDVSPGDSENAIDAMLKSGVVKLKLEDIDLS